MSITNGYSVDCGTAACCGGGVPVIYLANKTDFDSITIDANNKIDSITMNGAGVFYKFDMPDEKATSSSTVARAGCCGVYTLGVTGVFECLSQTNLDRLNELTSTCCGFVVIIVAANGERFMFGNEANRAAKFQEGAIEFGTALEDDNQSTWTLQAKQLTPMRQLDSTVVIPV